MHWTYEELKPDSDLRQGDILEPTEALTELFRDVHPHFAQKKYRGFLIVTQSCDMVRRKDKGRKCSTTHINLSVIRSLSDIISDSLKDRFGYLAPGIYDKQMEKAVRALAERLVNQNENTLGLFCLHPEIDSGISVHSVAILRVAISIKASLHYGKLIAARVGRLSAEFQPKLGWMVGNLYSRVGVTDWKEISEDKNTNSEEKLITDILAFNRDEPVWLDKQIYQRILYEKPNFDKLPISEQKEIIQKFRPDSPKDKLIDIIIETIKKVIPDMTDEHLKKIKTRLINNVPFEAQMRKYSKYQ